MNHYSVAGEEIFESSDCSENAVVSSATSRQHLSNQSYDKAGDGVDSDPINADRGFEYFHGKLYMSSKQLQIYSLADAAELRVEAPKQRLARLRQELSSFASDLAAMTEEQNNSESTVWHALQEEARNLIATATELTSAAESASKRNSIEGLEEITNRPLLRPESGPSNITAFGTDISRSEQRTCAQVALEYDTRLAALEASVGSWSGEKNETEVNGSIVETIKKLESRVQFLDGTATDALRSKLSGYKAELEATLSTKVRASTHTETKLLEAIKKLDELHSSAQKYLSVYADLPALVLRLKTLEALHLSASDCVRHMQRLDTAVSALDTEVQSNKVTLATLSEGLKQNMEEIRTTMQSFENRLNVVVASKK